MRISATRESTRKAYQMSRESLLTKKRRESVRDVGLSRRAALGGLRVFVAEEEACSVVRVLHICVVGSRPGNRHRISVESISIDWLVTV